MTEETTEEIKKEKQFKVLTAVDISLNLLKGKLKNEDRFVSLSYISDLLKIE